MGSPVDRFQVLGPVVQRVAVPVVHDVSPWQRAVHQLPHHDGSWAPHVRLGHLHPHPPVVAPARTSTHSDGAHGGSVAGPLAPPELRAGRAAFALPRPGQVRSCLRAAPVRAVVDISAFRRLAVERCTAHGALERVCLRPRAAQGRAISSTALGRAEDQAVAVPGQPVGLHLHGATATATCRVNHALKPTGTGTTVTVDTTTAEEAISHA